MNFDDPVQYKIDYMLSPKEQWLAVPKERRDYLVKAMQYHVEHFTKLLSETSVDDSEYSKTVKILDDAKKVLSMIQSYENSSCETVPVPGID